MNKLEPRRGSDLPGSQLRFPDGQCFIFVAKILWVRLTLQPYSLAHKNRIPSYIKGVERDKVKLIDSKYIKYLVEHKYQFQLLFLI